MNLATYAADLMMTCPYLSIARKDMHIDNTTHRATNYSIEGEPIGIIVKQYMGGCGALKQYTFALVSRKSTFTDADRAENALAYENVARWFEELTRLRKLPLMEPGFTPKKMEALDGVYLMERAEDGDSGLYSMQCRLTYFENARK